MKKLIAVALSVAAVATALPAAAAVQIWNFNNVTFKDGGALSGSFQYDPVANSFSNFSIATTAGFSLPAQSYTTANSNMMFFSIFSPNGIVIVLLDGSKYVHVALNAPLESASSHTLNSSLSYECVNCVPSRFMNGGTLDLAAGIPEPTTWAMMIGGFGLIGGAMRRRSSRAVI